MTTFIHLVNEIIIPADGFTVRVEVTIGAISVCGSREIERPDCSYSPTYDWKRDITISTEVFISGSGLLAGSKKKRQAALDVNAIIAYVTVEGLDNNNTFSLNTTFGDTTSGTVMTSSHRRGIATTPDSAYV